MKPELCRPKKSPSTLPASGCRAFSLVEMIAVLAVIAVLASVLLPAAIKRIDLRTREQEVVKLGAINTALTQWALRTKSVPDSSAWCNAAANYGSIAVSQVAANSRRFNRIYYPQSTSFAQTVDGLPSHPGVYRALVVSVLGGDALKPGVNCPNPSAIADAEFQYLWGLADGTRPTTGLWASWNGRADDVLIQRIDYAPLFHHLILVNRDVAPAPQFTIDDFPIQTLPQHPGRAAYYLDGTVIGLCMPDGTVTNRYILKRDISFVFDRGVWRCKIAGVPIDDPTANDFAMQAQLFMGADWNEGAVKGANQQGIVTAMYTFMLTYTFWANRYPHFSSTTTIQQVPEYIVLNKLGDPSGKGGLQDFSDRLLGKNNP